MKIYHIVIDKKIIYVGQTKNIEQRYRQHKYLLKRGIHKNKALQRAYNKHGSFEVVEVVDTDRPDIVEQEHILKHKTKQRNNRQAVYTIDELRNIYIKYHS